MTALQRAVALAEVNDAAFAIAEHLDFDVARPFKVFFQIKRIVAERGFRLGARQRHRRAEVALAAHDFHAAPAAARRRLDHDGKADVAGKPQRLVVADAAVGARHDRNAQVPGCALGGDLVAHQADVLGAGADEMHIVVGQNLRKARILREKAIPGMHGVGAGDFARGEDCRNIQIAVFCRRRTDANALIGEPHMHRVLIRGRVDRDGRDAKLLAGAQHPQCNLPTVGDQDLVEHRSAGHRERRIARGE